jgi:hypothetical protein
VVLGKGKSKKKALRRLFPHKLPNGYNSNYNLYGCFDNVLESVGVNVLDNLNEAYGTKAGNCI